MSRHYPEPPYPSQKQPKPGSTREMKPRPDHGEDSYKPVRQGVRRVPGNPEPLERRLEQVAVTSGKKAA
jgi:hypothetical protein